MKIKMETKRNKEGSLGTGLALVLAGPILFTIIGLGTYVNDKVQGIERIYSGPFAQCYTIDKDGDGNPDEMVKQRFVGLRFPACVPVTERYKLK